MPQPPDWKRVLETGMNFTELRRSQAYRLATELVAQGQLARDQIGAAVDELVEISRRRSEELRAIVAAEVQRQLSALGLATKRDLDALERRLRGKTPAAKASPKTAKPTGAKRAAAKKTPAKKTPATKTPAKKKAARRKAPAKKTAAKKTAATRSAAKRSTVKRATKRARRPAAGRAR
jgi:polyhydroxyalkanoate synthesis regulator phasin